MVAEAVVHDRAATREESSRVGLCMTCAIGNAGDAALDRLQHERLRDGASTWGIFEDTAQPCRFLETFLVASWAEHLRQHQRVTNADYVLQQHINQLLQGEVQITHFIAPRP